MVPTSPRPFPWISITRFPQVGQHHPFERREKKLFAEVQSALTTFSLMIDFVRA